MRLRLRRISIFAFALLMRPANRALGPARPVAGYQPAELSGLAALLRREAAGMPCAVIDLDRLDRNIARALQAAGSSRLRIVAKSLPSIGQSFGRNHATVLHAHRLVGDRIKSDVQFRQTMMVLQQRLTRKPVGA